MAPPTAGQYLSPRLLRALLGLSSIRPVVPNILYRTAVAALARGVPGLAPLYAHEALRIDPGHRPAADLLRQLGGPGVRGDGTAGRE